MTPLERFKLLMGAFLVEEWQSRAEWGDETIGGFLEHGIPIEYARMLADLTKGALPVSFWPKVVHPPKVLHDRKHLGTVNDMTSDHALAISKTQRGKDRKFRAAMHGAKLTQNALAEKLGISSASLTRYRDKRPIPKAIADKVKDLTGYDGGWPGGVVE